MDQFTAEDLKAQGMAAALQAQDAWRDRVDYAIRHLTVGAEGTFEQLRLRISPFTGEPRHPSAWGAVCNAFIREGVLVPVAKPLAATTTPTNHACKRQVLRKANN